MADVEQAGESMAGSTLIFFVDHIVVVMDVSGG